MGFDLDMTLIDTVPGFMATLTALGDEFGVAFPVEEMTSGLGPPLDVMLAEHLDPDQIGPAADRFREIYPDLAVTTTPLLPGAREAIEAVRAYGGRVLVVTGKFPRNAQLHVDHLSLDIDHLEGWVWGAGKADVLRREGADMLVGDHVHDVEGALAAGVLSVSVLTGGSSRMDLVAAGTHVVLDDLASFPAWLDGYVDRSRAAHAEGAS